MLNENLVNAKKHVSAECNFFHAKRSIKKAKLATIGDKVYLLKKKSVKGTMKLKIFCRINKIVKIQNLQNSTLRKKFKIESCCEINLQIRQFL